ncbi:hypothetical protein J4710_02915 [Staphylococcus xylosus]|uniref:Uncharacterized protein n=1 Tax=Staphylococcus xylosus TaxID=1288 RepID=A0A939ND67_STAXY|nr:hypothetical protein [Staphylococcus xylosus]
MGDAIKSLSSSHRHTLELINTNKQSVAHAIKQWSAKDLEEAAEKGVVMPMVEHCLNLWKKNSLNILLKNHLLR